MALASEELTYVGVRVPVENLDLAAGTDISEEMTIGRLVSTAEYNHEAAPLDMRTYGIAQLLLIGFDVARDLEVAEIPSAL